MIEQLCLFHTHNDFEQKSLEILSSQFLLRTCQRNIVLSLNKYMISEISQHYKKGEYHIYYGIDAYHFLLETICGLKSRLIGEYEIVSQFKKAYNNYTNVQTSAPNPHLMGVIEKLFKDAKEVRTNYLMEIGSESYAGITRKILKQKNYPGNVLILGSGSLASDLIKILYKKFPLTIAARNKQKSFDLANTYQLETADWGQKMAFADYKMIVSTIGPESPIFDHSFFEIWRKKQKEQNLFIDLGSPTAINTSFNSNHGIMRLQNIFDTKKEMNQSKNSKINSAKLAIKHLADKRKASFTITCPHGWGELSFV